ncbi:MAG: DUF308 domain-containing protein [Prevotella sp.]|nr:DUF308 domain-containing protein [Prevotella sp.]
MKVLQSSVLRALIAVIVGVLLVKYREDTMKWMTITAGVLFFMSGLISCIVYYYEKRRIEKESISTEENDGEKQRRSPMFPFVGVGSMILGGILALMPTDFIIGVTYVLGGMLILGAVSQFVSLALARKFWSIPFVFWLFPLILLAVGVLVIAKPMQTATLPLQIIGWALMFYGIVECINTLMIYSARKKYMAAENAKVISGEPIEDAVIVEEQEQPSI